ncbi:MAG: hypothetical protein HOC74_33005 [Gemmatimonadetes bacterium]|jgi:hypothetical protein|nr:hypothetical protein [Gemmatimonadota bacterium]
MPNYEKLRDQTPFHWRVGSTYYAYFAMTDVPLREVNLDPEAMIELVRRGRPLFREMWGDDVPLPSLSTPAISYGHLNGLGAELIFPEGGEVSFTKICSSLEEGIELLRKPVDYATAGMAPFYLDYRRRLQEAFPGESVGFSFSVQGPMTTAYCLRGDGIFYDVYDDPIRFAQFLDLCVDSILEYKSFLADLSGQPRISPTGTRLYDDVASMFAPEMWPEFVLPFLERYFRGLTTGTRGAHIEDLRREHLLYLEEIGLVDFDPGISHKLSPPIIRDDCRVPFGWRMGSFHYHGLTLLEVEEWVYQAVADGASHLFTYIVEETCKGETIEKIRVFTRALKEVEQLLAGGTSRSQIGERVGASGKKRFWDHWPE